MEIPQMKNWYVKDVLLKAFVCIGLLFVVGCAGSHMMEVPDAKVRSTPRQTEAMVIFIRPSSMYANHSSSLFDITDGTPKFIGILAPWKKIAYPIEPGKHRFMVAARGRRAEFIDARLANGKSYYIRVIPSFWVGIFPLEPYRGAELDTPGFSENLKDAAWVTNTPNSRQWAVNNKTSIMNKLAGLSQWLKKSDRPILRPEDGR